MANKSGKVTIVQVTMQKNQVPTADILLHHAVAALAGHNCLVLIQLQLC